MAKERPRCGGRWTEARYRQFVRTALRNATVKWGPKHDALESASRPTTSRDKRRRKDYQCAICGLWWPPKGVQVDHIVPVGSCEDWNAFIERMFCEEDGLRVLCLECHKNETDKPKEVNDE